MIFIRVFLFVETSRLLFSIVLYLIKGMRLDIMLKIVCNGFIHLPFYLRNKKWQAMLRYV